MPSRSAYKGPRRKLVLAFDIGTTYSGISYSVLDPGQVPEIKGVTRFPVHEQVNGASKIPTIIYYDRDGKVRAVGAEAASEEIYAQAEEGNWDKAQWFKLHLRSKIGPRAGREVSDEIPPLPLNKTVVEVFADFLAYLFICASSYIQETHANGATLWASVKDEIHFVLSHPNGWEGTEQSKMREAIVLARLIPGTPAGYARLSFVTEGEASLHFAIRDGLPKGVMKNGDGVIIVDAGGGTIDISSYSKKISASRATFEEVAASQCHFHGSVFVNIHARQFLKSYLAESRFVDDIEHIVICFDKTAKLRFRTAEDDQYVKFGSTRDNDPAYNIRFGQLKLLGIDVASFFKPSIDCIVNAVTAQNNASGNRISHVVLVGGFSANNYMFNMVSAALNPAGFNVLRPESHVNKAVSDGAISFYLDHFVRSRVSKMTYGVSRNWIYDPKQADHLERSSTAYMGASGFMQLQPGFDVILPKNTQVKEMKEFRTSCSINKNSENELNRMHSTSIWCYRGSMANPKWRDIDTKDYTKLCSLGIDSSSLPKTKCQKHGAQRGTFYYQAQIAWMEGGIEKRTPAKIIYDPDDAA